MLRTQEGYFADRVVYPNERFLVEAQLRELRPVVLGLRHDAMVYGVTVVASFVLLVLSMLLWPSLFWGAALGGSMGLFACRFGFADAQYLDARRRFASLYSLRMELIMEDVHDAEAEFWMRRSKEKARGGGR